MGIPQGATGQEHSDCCIRAFSSRGSSLMQSIAETCVRFDAAHLSINLVSEIAVPMFTTLKE